MTVITDKLVEVDGVLILSPSLHQCSVLREFKTRQNYTASLRREVESHPCCWEVVVYGRWSVVHGGLIASYFSVIFVSG